jgi:hypothetical protein
VPELFVGNAERFRGFVSSQRSDFDADIQGTTDLDPDHRGMGYLRPQGGGSSWGRGWRIVGSLRLVNIVQNWDVILLSGVYLLCRPVCRLGPLSSLHHDYLPVSGRFKSSSYAVFELRRDRENKIFLSSSERFNC